LPREEILTTKIYRFFQEIKVYPRKNAIFANKEKFTQEEI
jgi:hypothetical protein